MKYVKKITDLPCFDLESTLKSLYSKNRLDLSQNKQICLNSTKPDSDDVLEGTGSLVKDWSRAEMIIDSDGNDKFVVPERKVKLKETDFKFLCTQFQNTEFEILYNLLNEKYTLGRVRLMILKPHSCLSWHYDFSHRLHYPIKTQKGCFMNINGEVIEMKRYNWYLADTTVEHTAVNASNEDRIHLVATIENFNEM